MNTTITKQQFLNIRKHIKQLARDKQLVSRDIIIYNIIRGLPSSHGFTRVTNPNKLANGVTIDGQYSLSATDLIRSLNHIVPGSKASLYWSNRYSESFLECVHLIAPHITRQIVS